MIDLKDFQAHRRVLEVWYDRLLDARKLLQVDDAALREAKENLHEDRFIVAVCGQMNSGKSTLLNALLFSDEVLPSAATTTTAKITVMDGCEKESVEATLYTFGEFQRVLDESKKDIRAAAELSEARESARAAGLRESQLLTDVGRVERRTGLDDLYRFAVVSRKGGTYNVYVKSVHVWADRSWLHQVTVADTPGTNDPNPERDRITREWIRRSDAVVYVTFAGQGGMDAEDVKFIDEHLAHVSPGHRIIAVNKCDYEPNVKAIWSHIRKIRHSGDLRMKSLFGADDQIVLTSGLGGLIAAMKDEGRMLSADMRWQAQNMSDRGYLDAEQHGIKKLRDLIERRVIDNKGEGVIRAHHRRIAELFERTERRLAQDEVDLRHHLEAVASGSKERTKEIDRVSHDILALAGHVCRAKKGVDSVMEPMQSTLDRRLREVRERVMQSVIESLGRVTRVEGLAKQAHWSIQDALYKERDTVAACVRELMNGVETMLNDAENELSEEFMRSGFGKRFPHTHLLPVSARTICTDAEDKLMTELNPRSLSEGVRKATKWWQRMFDTPKGKKRGIENLHPALERCLHQALEFIPESTARDLKKLADDAVHLMEESCGKTLKKRGERLEALEREGVSDEEMRERINQELSEVAEQKRRVKELQDEYKAAVAG
ncbi:MAG: dynamin family protein [Spirochaetaceae bacterium]|nr:dynamin family protein [Spirochaetaceae bacterium]